MTTKKYIIYINEKWYMKYVSANIIDYYMMKTKFLYPDMLVHKKLMS